MSDVIDLNNLEDDTPAVAAVEEAPVEAPVEAAPVVEVPAVVEAKVDPEPGDDPRVSGLKNAVIAERAKRQGLEKRAQRADELERYLTEKAPYITVLEQNPDLFKRPQAPTAPEPVAQPSDDPDALEAAKLMDFYTADGKPDAAKGAQWLNLQDRRSARVTQQAIQPWQNESLQTKSDQNFYRVLQVQTPDGRKPSEQAVRAIWGKVMAEPGGMKTLANAEAASFLAIAALGVDALMHKSGPAAPAKDPVVTEASGGGARPNAQPISALEEKVLRNRGVSASDWQKHTAGYRPGRPTNMEED